MIKKKKKNAKISKKQSSNKYTQGKKKSCYLVPKVVIDLPFEGKLKKVGKTEGGKEFRRKEVEGKKPSLNWLILALESLQSHVVLTFLSKSIWMLPCWLYCNVPTLSKVPAPLLLRSLTKNSISNWLGFVALKCIKYYWKLHLSRNKNVHCHSFQNVLDISLNMGVLMNEMQWKEWPNFLCQLYIWIRVARLAFLMPTFSNLSYFELVGNKNLLLAL